VTYAGGETRTKIAAKGCGDARNGLIIAMKRSVLVNWMPNSLVCALLFRAMNLSASQMQTIWR